MAWIEVESRGRRCLVNVHRIAALQELVDNATEIHLVGLPEPIVARRDLDSILELIRQSRNKAGAA